MQGTRTLQCIVCVVFGITLTVHMNTAIFPTTATLLITDTKTAELYSSHRNALPFRDRLKWPQVSDSRCGMRAVKI